MFLSKRDLKLSLSRLLGSETKGYGHGGTNCYSVDICPDLLLAAISAAAALAFYLLYMAITMVPVGRKRRKRNLDKDSNYGNQRKGKYLITFSAHCSMKYIELLNLFLSDNKWNISLIIIYDLEER